MPRNQNGSYSLPEPPVKPGDTVRSDWANNTTGDIGKALTDSLDRNGVGGMRGPLKLSDGTEINPSMAFTNDPSIGFIRIRSGVMGMVFGGKIMCEISVNGVTYLNDGRVFLANDPGVDTEAATKRYVDATSAGALSKIPDGTQAEPGLAFINEPDSGLYRAGDNDIGLSVGNKRVVRFQRDAVSVDGQVNATKFAGDGSQLTNLTLPVTEPSFPAGTVMTFGQTAAPTGWTKLTTHNNKALRVVSGTAGSGGSVNFTTAFTARTVNATVLTVAQMPAHNHAFSTTTASAGSHKHTGSSSVGGRSGWFAKGGYSFAPDNSAFTVSNPYGTNVRPGLDYNSGGQERVNYNADHSHTMNLDAAGGHTHSLSGASNNTGGTQGHAHALNMDVQYVDVIMARKD